MTRSSLAAAIVAGGRASRFGGRDKSRLIVDGQAIIVRQMEALGRIADEIFVVANDARPFADLGVPVHADAIPNVGVIGGIYTALQASPSERVLVVACDMPFLDARVLQRLADLAGNADGAWVRTKRGVEPLLACYRHTANDTVRREIEAGRLKPSDLDRVLRIAALDEDELARFGSVERLLLNVNTPEDHARLSRLP